MATTTNFGWETPDDTDLVKDGALAIRTLGSAIDTSLVDLKGGTTGQVLSKTSNTDMDFTWVAQDDSNAIQNAIIDAKGDLIVGTAADTPARLAVGTNGYVLTADSAEASGVKWAAAAGGGKVLQVIQDTDTSNYVNTGGSGVESDTGLSVTITPSSASSKILVMASMPRAYTYKSSSSTDTYGSFYLVRTSTKLQTAYIGVVGFGSSAGKTFYTPVDFMYLDSPATTSATTYKVTAANQDSTEIAYVASSTVQSSIVVMEIGA